MGQPDADWESCVRSQGAYSEGDWGIIDLWTMFLVSCIFFNKCLYFSCYMAGYFLDSPLKSTVLGALNSVLNHDKRQKACPCGVHIQVIENKQLTVCNIFFRMLEKNSRKKTELGERFMKYCSGVEKNKLFFLLLFSYSCPAFFPLLSTILPIPLSHRPSRPPVVL